MLMTVAVVAQSGLSIVLLHLRRQRPRLHQAHQEGVLLPLHSLVVELRAVVVGAGRDCMGFISRGMTIYAHFSAHSHCI